MDVIMPQLGETVAEGTIGTWFKELGAAVREGEALFEIETDKVTMEVQALAAGVIAEIRVAAGETAPVGAVVAVIASASGAPYADVAPATKISTSAESNAAGQIVLDPYLEVRTPQRVEGAREISGIKITPLARRLIVQAGLEAKNIAEFVQKSGRTRVMRDDVLEATRLATGLAAQKSEAAPVTTGVAGPLAVANGPVSSNVPAADYDVVALNRTRRKSAEHLTRAWQEIPHVTQGVEANFQRIERARAAANAVRRDGEPKLTYLPFVARAVCRAIREFPEVNASLDEGQLRVHRRVHLGIAVDLDHDGLVVPVIRNADDLTLPGLARALDRLVGKARSGKLAADDLVGATYSISNSGTFGTLFTTPIVNPPQVAILSTDGVTKRPIVIEDPEGDRVAVGRVGVLTQSFDHRAFDGAYSAAFLRRLQQIIETHDWASEF